MAVGWFYLLENACRPIFFWWRLLPSYQCSHKCGWGWYWVGWLKEKRPPLAPLTAFALADRRERSEVVVYEQSHLKPTQNVVLFWWDKGKKNNRLSRKLLRQWSDWGLFSREVKPFLSRAQTLIITMVHIFRHDEKVRICSLWRGKSKGDFAKMRDDAVFFSYC